MAVNVVSRVHPGLQLLLDLTHVLSRGGVEGSNIAVTARAVTDSSQPMPGVVPHHVVLHPGVLLTVVGLPDMGLVLVTVPLRITPGGITTTRRVALALPLPPPTVTLPDRVLDPELGRPVPMMVDATIRGHRTDVVTVNGSTSTNILSVVGTDDVGRGCDSQNGR